MKRYVEIFLRLGGMAVDNLNYAQSPLFSKNIRKLVQAYQLHPPIENKLDTKSTPHPKNA